MQVITPCQVPNLECPAALLQGVTSVPVSTDDERRIAWTHRLIGTDPKPEGSDWRESGKYVGVLDAGWVKRTFGQEGKPLTGTALSYWRKKGIPLEHLPRMIEELQALLPDTEKEPPWVGRLQAKVDSILANQGRLALLIRQPPVTVKPDERLAVQYLRELLAGIPPQPVEDSPEGDGSPDRGAPDRAAQ